MAKKKATEQKKKEEPQLDGLSGFNMTFEARDLFYRLTREDPNLEDSKQISKLKLYTISYYDLVALSVGMSWKKNISSLEIPRGSKTHGINAPQLKTEHVDIYRTIFLLKKYEELLKKKGNNKENITPEEYRDLLREFGNNASVKEFTEKLCNGAFFHLKNLIEGVTIPNNSILDFLFTKENSDTDS